MEAARWSAKGGRQACLPDCQWWRCATEVTQPPPGQEGACSCWTEGSCGILVLGTPPGPLSAWPSLRPEDTCLASATWKLTVCLGAHCLWLASHAYSFWFLPAYLVWSSTEFKARNLLPVEAAGVSSAQPGEGDIIPMELTATQGVAEAGGWISPLLLSPVGRSQVWLFRMTCLQVSHVLEPGVQLLGL